MSKGVTSTPYNLQLDILSVYDKALDYSITHSGRISNQKFIEASSQNNSSFKVYFVKDYFNIKKYKLKV